MSERAIRLADVARGDQPDADFDDARICYWRDPVEWWIYLPGSGIGCLTRHSVIEHEDGTITVTPSIAQGRAGGRWKRHGFLARGVWNPCGDDQPPAARQPDREGSRQDARQGKSGCVDSSRGFSGSGGWRRRAPGALNIDSQSSAG